MNSTTRNVLATVAGLIGGSIVNLGLITVGMEVIPLPAGADTSTMEALRETMKLLSPVNFVFPLVAHALGTLTGALVAAKLAASHRLKLALGIGVFFLCGGIAMIVNCGGPPWFIVTDLALAYLPMAYLGASLGGAGRARPEQV